MSAQSERSFHSSCRSYGLPLAPQRLLFQ